MTSIGAHTDKHPMISVLSIIGTRPEAIKMAPVIRELARYPERIKSQVCVTAQHRELTDSVLRLFQIVPDFDLDVMSANQTSMGVMRLILERLEPILIAEKPDWILVQGDTTTVMVATLMAFHLRIRVGHVEAGLRTGDLYNPYPEEANRRIADLLAALYFAPTDQARQNLLREGVPDSKIAVTGNPGIDALLYIADQPAQIHIHGNLRRVLVTTHRRENFGAPLESICAAVRDLAEQYADSLQIILPIHPNPNVEPVVRRILGSLPNVALCPPLDYLPLVHLLKRCVLVLTDSGGLQEEAPSFGVPVLVLRETTERPEAVAAGTARVVGTDRARIVAEARAILDSPAPKPDAATIINPYGDGQAARRIVERLLLD